MNPNVTTVVATRGRPLLLRRALRTIVRQQGIDAHRVVVVFDQTELELREDLVADLDLGDRDVDLVVVPNAGEPGLAGGRNTGVRYAVGSKYVAFCDDDDEWDPNRLQRQISLLEDEPAAVAASCGIRIVTDRGVVERIPPRYVAQADFRRSRVSAVHPSTLLVRRHALAALDGPVDERIPASYGEDYDLLLRLSERGGVVSPPDVLVTVHWDRPSFFAERWRSVAEGLEYLLDKHEVLLVDPRNAARMGGQIAFAHAAAGQRASARVWARRSLTFRRSETRAWAALAVASGLVSPALLVRSLNRLGKGV